MSIASSSLLDLASQAPSAMALHKKYIAGARRAPLQLRTQAVGAVYDRPGFFVQSPAHRATLPRLSTLELATMRLKAVIVMILVGSLWASAQSVRIDLEPVIASGLNQPLYLTNAHDGTGRRFVVEQPGRISVMQPGSSTRTTFLDITGRVLSGGERGLLGLAFHPQFASNRRFFVDYTRRPDGATVIAEYRVSTSNPNVAQTSE